MICSRWRQGAAGSSSAIEKDLDQRLGSIQDVIKLLSELGGSISFDSYEQERTIAFTGTGRVLLVRHVNRKRSKRFVARTVEPVTNNAQQRRRLIDSFLDPVYVQKTVADAGASYWAMIHEISRMPNGAYYVTDYHTRSVDELIRGADRISGRRLYVLIRSILKGLVELRRACDRPHGNLTADSIWLTGKHDRVKLSLPLPTAQLTSHDDKADLRRLGELMYQLVEHKTLGGRAKSVLYNAAWSSLGPEARQWHRCCNALLGFGSETKPLTVVSVLRDYLPLLRPWRRAVRLVASTGVFVLLAVGGYEIMQWTDPDGRTPKSLAVVESKPPGVINPVKPPVPTTALDTPSVISTVIEDLTRDDNRVQKTLSGLQQLIDVTGGGDQKIQELEDQVASGKLEDTKAALDEINQLLTDLPPGGSVAKSAMAFKEKLERRVYGFQFQGVDFVYIEPGKFVMGSTLAERQSFTSNQAVLESLEDEGPTVLQSIDRPYYLAAHEVTVGQFRAFVAASNPPYETQAEAERRIVESAFSWILKETWFNKDFMEFTPKLGVNWQHPGFGDRNAKKNPSPGAISRPQHYRDYFERTRQDILVAPEERNLRQEEDHPVVCVSYDDAQAFCQWLNRKVSQDETSMLQGKFRLPNSKEWEYACRAGTAHSPFFWDGQTINKLAYCNGLSATAMDYINKIAYLKPLKSLTSDRFAWTDDWVFTSPSGAFPPNPWGLYAMHGNASEWVADTKDFLLSPRLRLRQIRGGDWASEPIQCRSAFKDYRWDHYHDSGLGFRVVWEPDP